MTTDLIRIKKALSSRKQSADVYDIARQAATAGLRSRAISDIKRLLMVGLGTGAALRGGKGMLELLQANAKRPAHTLPGQVIIEAPVKRDREEKKGELNLVDWLAKGQGAESKTGIPWYMPGAVGAAGGGLYGGWKLMDWLLAAKKKRDLSASVASAKADYEAALQGDGKTAEDGSLRKELDGLCDLLEKRSFSAEDLLGKVLGIYGIYTGGTGLLGAVAGYQFGKARLQKRLLASAIKERKKRRASRQPPAIYIRPVEEADGKPKVEDPYRQERKIT